MENKDKKIITFIKKAVPVLIFMAAVFALDQIVKNMAIRSLSSIPGRSVSVLDGVLSLTLTTNSGAAWSIFAGSRAFLILVSFAAFALIYYLFKSGFICSELGRWTMFSVIAGALGNLYDRLFRVGGLVIDMFQLDFINFPIFNVADIFISCGGILFVIVYIFDTAKAEKAKKEAENMQISTDDAKEDSDDKA